ncbi:MAG TPA: hypothetical protein ENN90_00105 [Mariniphaga anaerophila]|uniref:Uncharacterized protein n=1 Tax=Mariniphaga anaerophila TaxID=1484053 RepID=A0A831LM38_9BACT|nr:hypothetical protein [Mariniphaga anaerophila]
MKAINITAYTDDASQIEAIKAVFKAFKIKYKITKAKDENSLYDPEFVAKIKQGEKDLKNGKGIKMTLDELENLCK